MQRISLILAALLMMLPFGIYAQASNGGAKYANIKGRIVEDKPQGEPVGFATVHILPQDIYTTTDFDGNYELKNVEPGETTFSIQFIGMETIETTVNIVAGKTYTFDFKMKETSFRLEEVRVLAEQSKAGSATASNISKQAIDHLQASTLKDIMQLLPGASLQNSNMSVANNIYIRTIAPTSNSRTATTATDDSYANMNSLGTAIIMDGAALSNNANMQLLSSSGSVNSNVGVGATPAAGYDMRGISTDNIESVEVIRGIPSAQYGDMTSGAVIIKTKAGREPLRVKVNLNPYTYSVSASKGISLGEKGGAFSISGDYAYDSRQQDMAHQYYQRFTLRGLWTKTFFDRLTTNTSLDLKYRKDTREKNPDDVRTQTAFGAKEIGFRFNSNGSYTTPDAGWLKRLSYTLSFSFTDKHSYRESMATNAYSPYLMTSVDGAVLSSIAGLKIYDKNSGEEITNIPSGEESYYGTYLPYSYFSRYDIYGKELNFQGSVKAHFNKRWTKSSNNILVGFDYKMDGNLGKGTVYDIATPPQSNSGSSAYRPRAFKDIPFVNQLSGYVEDVFTHEFGKHEFKLTGGVRFDWINRKSAITPRLNGSFEIVPDRLFLRGGWGILAKAPTSLYLYPQEAYYEFVNYNTLGDESLAEDMQLLVGTTKVFNTKNTDLKIAKNRKAEIGFDFKFNHNKMSVAVTGYHEKLRNGYTMGTSLDGFNLIPYVTYKNLEKDANGRYTLEVDNISNIFVSHATPMNSLETINKGIEYEVNLGRIEALRTQININGAYMYMKNKNNNYSYSTNSNGNSLEHHIGVYEKAVAQRYNEVFNTTFRFIHNIPKIGFVITLAAQANWFTKTWTEYGNDTMFEKYISYKDGKVYDFDPAMKDDPEFSYLFDVPNDRRFIKEKYDPYLIFNINVSKEIGDFLTASFFANNIFNTRPLYERKMYPGSYYELGIPTFFGFDLKINIK